MLSTGDFATYFQELHGVEPFPWQQRLLETVAAHGEWPAVLDLPTGSGKTAAMDVALFHLALEADRGERRTAPLRIAFVVDRRLVVDDAYARARRIAEGLLNPSGRATSAVADRLRLLSQDGPPVMARRLRGGIPREDDWARTPAQPTILCSTVDQVGSRLLFRGYGISDAMKPVHAGLLGSDCLILLDEAHLAEPFRQTLQWVAVYHGREWRNDEYAAPWGVALLTATPGADSDRPAGPSFSLSDIDRSHPVLRKRLEATKLARLVLSKRAAAESESDPREPASDGAQADRDDADHRATLIVGQLKLALSSFHKTNREAGTPAIGVVVNRIARARAVFDLIQREMADEIASGKVTAPLLMIGPARPVDRDGLADALAPIRTHVFGDGGQRRLSSAFIVVATQCIEAGVDVDLDCLITELAPLDALRQRFGRLNRAGRDIVTYAAVVATRVDIGARYVDPVYGSALRPSWSELTRLDEEGGRRGVDFGISADAFELGDSVLAPRPNAPVLLPAHLDLLSHTSPVPALARDVAIFLRGPDRQPDSVSVAWRADIEELDDAGVRRLLTLVPPRTGEVIELPVWAVRRWLEGRSGASDSLGDVTAAIPDDERTDSTRLGGSKRVFRWRGDDPDSVWIEPRRLRPGDAIVVSSRIGGLDGFGWKPASTDAVADVAQQAARPFAGRRFTVRVAPGLLGDDVSSDALSAAIAGAPTRRWQDVRDAVLELPLPDAVRADLALLDSARGRKGSGQRVVVPYLDAYGTDADGRPRGVIFVAPFGLVSHEHDLAIGSTEDDAAGSMPGFALKLAPHNEAVAAKAKQMAIAAGIPSQRANDVEIAAQCHDLGKVDTRFQAWLHYGDPLGGQIDPSDALAKSGRTRPHKARAESGLPDRWRHEALSVRMAIEGGNLEAANDPQLVAWLVGTHHGFGRPLYPHADPTEHTPRVGPQSLEFDWLAMDWATLFSQLKARYGTWELARMEAIVRLADHRASEEEEG